MSFSQESENLRSALEHPDIITSEYASLIPKGRLHGPFPTPPSPAFRSSPLGVVFRKRSNKARLIHHLSWPPGLSVNDGIADSEAYISYDFFDRAMQDLRQAGPGALMGKLDLLQAFRHIPVRLADRPLLGSSWQGQYYYSPVLTFGLRSAPYIFNLFAEALHWIIARHIPGWLRHYLDDFLNIFHPSTPSHIASAAMDWIQSLGEQLGLFFQAEKTVRPTTVIEFLGLILDSIAMEARLPEDKLSFLQSELSQWLQRSRCSLKELQELIGYLQFASQVIPTSRAFIRRLIDFSSTFPSPFAHRHIPSSAKADLRWWAQFSLAWNGVRILTPPKTTFHVWTDASGTKGIGGVFGTEWFAARVPRRHRTRHADGRPTRDIQFKELYAVVDAVMRWGDTWKGGHVVFHGDNTAIVDLLTDLSNRSAPSMGLLRFLLSLSHLEGPPSDWYREHARYSQTSAFYLWHGLASSTRKTYSTGQKSFITYARIFGWAHSDGSVIPASLEAVIDWVSWLAPRVAVQTARAYLNHVRSLHVDNDLEFTHTDSPILQRLFRGIKRYHGEPGRKERLPITLPVLQSLLPHLPSSDSHEGAVLRAACTLAFAGFLRCGEFTLPKANARWSPYLNLTRHHVIFHPSFENPTHLTLTLPASKTDPFRKGITILVAAAPDTTTCAVTALKHLFTTFPQPDDSALFTRSSGNPIDRAWFIEEVRKALDAAGHNSPLYSGHSFRRGAASTAAAVGYASYEIQQLGRWRSDAFKLYIDSQPSRLLHLSSLLHRARLSAPAPVPSFLPSASSVA